MHNKLAIFLSVILLFGLFLAPAGSVAAQAPERSGQDSALGVKSLPLVAPNLIQDPGMEAAYHVTTIWNQSSSNADWTVCATSNIDCLLAGVAGPRAGTKWGMFGI